MDPGTTNGGVSGDDHVDPIRMVTVWCPDWPVVAAGCRPDVPAAVMRAHRVVARTPAAADEGVVIGQRRRQAQQRCPHIRLLDDDPARDAREFEPIVRAVAEVAPRVDLVEPGWLSIAARGPSRYFGGDEAMAEHLRRVVLDVVTAQPNSDDGVEIAARGGCGSGRRPVRSERRRPPRCPPAGAGRRGARVGPRRSVRHFPSGGCRRSTKSTPSWSTCSVDWGCVVSGISPTSIPPMSSADSGPGDARTSSGFGRRHPPGEHHRPCARTPPRPGARRSGGADRRGGVRRQATGRRTRRPARRRRSGLHAAGRSARDRAR